MTRYRSLQTIPRRIAVAMAVSASLMALAPAAGAAAMDQQTQVPAARKDIRTLNPIARQLVWCVQPKSPDGKVAGKKQCKTREAWIREGKDPFGEY